MNLRERLFGDDNRLGWWTLPVFVAVGLLGAVLAGSLAAVYYAQKVAGLESETAAARKELTAAVERVEQVADDAVQEIESEVEQVREELAVTLALDDPAAAGIGAVTATVTVRSGPPAGPGATAAPAPAQTVQRNGSTFAVIASDDATFFATSFAVVVNPNDRNDAVDQATIVFDGQTLNARVHSWEPDRDLALLRVPGRIAEVPEWRPAEEALTSGSRVFATGVTPAGTFAEVGATVGAADPDVVVLDSGVPDVLRGGPVLDAKGRVVAIASTAYAPYGDGGSIRPAVPVRALCERLIQCNE